MGKFRRYKNRVERFLYGEGGQRFFNFAYSIGAAIVIWGALFKILHLPWGNVLLSIGMGTEVLMFILTAFDRPPKEYNWEEVFPVLDSKDPEDRPDFSSGAGVIVGRQAEQAVSVAPAQQSSAESIVSLQPVAAGEVGSASASMVEEMAGIAEQMSRLRQTTEALNQVSETLLASYRAITDNSENITQSSTGYVEQMQNLNRNIAGLNTIYEIQLKSVSSQLDAIDRVNKGIKDICRMYEDTSSASSRYVAESEKMAGYMAQLNAVYAKMLHAMTINMYAPGAPVAPQPETREPAPAEVPQTES
ncbi:MAG: gliding motility protein GldL [Barnesiella sp.]|nr:gliding motility protein GldL [Barnesiella sp.]